MVAAYPRIPLQDVFPDPGFDSPLPAVALVGGVLVLLSVAMLVLVVGLWRRRITR